MPETIALITAAHCEGTTTPVEPVVRTYGHIRTYNDPAVSLLSAKRRTRAEAETLAVMETPSCCAGRPWRAYMAQQKATA